MNKEQALQMGKSFGCTIDFQLLQDGEGKWYAYYDCDGTYYETDRYKSKDCAAAEMKGYLDGISIQINEILKALNKELEQ